MIPLPYSQFLYLILQKRSIKFVKHHVRNMNKRLQQFLEAENISQAQLADRLKVARASVSNILSGRNKPGFDFLESLSLHFPELNLEWMVTGRGRMYKQSQNDGKSSDSISEPEPTDTLFPLQEPSENVKSVENPMESRRIFASQDVERRSGRRVDKVVVFFNDGTFQEIIS